MKNIDSKTKKNKKNKKIIARDDKIKKKKKNVNSVVDKENKKKIKKPRKPRNPKKPKKPKEKKTKKKNDPIVSIFKEGVLSIENQNHTFLVDQNKDSLNFLKTHKNNFGIHHQTEEIEFCSIIYQRINFIDRIQYIKQLYDKILKCSSEIHHDVSKEKCFEICETIERYVFYYYDIDSSYEIFYKNTMQTIIDLIGQNGISILKNMNIKEFIYYLANTSYYLKDNEYYESYVKTLENIQYCKDAIDPSVENPFKDFKNKTKCKICGHPHVTQLVVQERSADEGANVYYICQKDKNHTWKIRG